MMTTSGARGRGHCPPEPGPEKEALDEVGSIRTPKSANNALQHIF